MIEGLKMVEYIGNLQTRGSAIAFFSLAILFALTLFVVLLLWVANVNGVESVGIIYLCLAISLITSAFLMEIPYNKYIKSNFTTQSITYNIKELSVSDKTTTFLQENSSNNTYEKVALGDVSNISYTFNKNEPQTVTYTYKENKKGTRAYIEKAEFNLSED